MKLHKGVINEIKGLITGYHNEKNYEVKSYIRTYYHGYITGLRDSGAISNAEKIILMDIFCYPEHAEELEALNR